MKNRITQICSFMLALLFTCTLSINVAATTVGDEAQNLKKAIEREPIFTIAVDSEEATEIIEKLEEQTSPSEAIIYNENSLIRESARVSFQPTYGYRNGDIEVYGTVTVHSSSIDTWISSVSGYIAGANNNDGWRADVYYKNYLPTKTTYIYESGWIYHSDTTDLVLFEGSLDVYLTGGWSVGTIDFYHEMYL